MDFLHVQTLYDLTRDGSADSKDREDARAYLEENENAIVAACLALPLAAGLKHPYFEDYLTVYARNCLDAPFVRDPVTKQMKADFSAFPVEQDRIGNCLMAVRRFDENAAKARASQGA
jgi:hypothetical protein